ncbi:proton-coupled zinc antiporter SLC30A2 isoform X1 [Octopus bimaculoides]|uniref:Zinc transporter 2-like n=1 Tax=Octopus bimaculoides TaxID=37653 RepID=A0A0L8FZN5_OCTBM|nr:proton-coupled zinc antiporter SLC30A2 isoform X1 [Octopus bimaculoides]|eukprot:XP_014785479.1 PREDICTED: zinc transporter 2-like isoform X1 [Octopus bimaculoides]
MDNHIFSIESSQSDMDIDSMVITNDFSSNKSQDSTTYNHCHRISISKTNTAKTRKTLIIASCLCLFFMIIEIIGGYLADSLAIMTDAAHLLTDFVSFIISLLSVYLASRPATKKYSFGWHRAEILGALVSVLFIWVVTAILIYLAILRVINEDYEINATIMIITSAAGIFINVLIALVLHKHSHGHSHGLNHHHNDEENRLLVETKSYGSSNDMSLEEDLNKKKHKNINVKAAFIHVIGDLLQSVGVLIAAYIIYFKPEYKIADPICTFIFSVFVFISTVTILRDIINVLMEGVPRSLKFSQVKELLNNVSGVKAIHNLRMWCLTTNKIALSVHLAVDQYSDPLKIMREATNILTNRFGPMEVTIQVEEYEENMNECAQCQDPKD